MQAKYAVSILFGLIVSCLVQTELEASPGGAVPESRRAEAREIFGPFWATDQGRDTNLVLNNPGLDQQTVLLTFFEHNGQLLLERTVELESLESRTISIARFLSGRKSHGHFVATFSGESIQFLPTQTFVSTGAAVWSIDSFDPILHSGQPTSAFALAQALPGGRGTVVLTNRGSESLFGVVRWGGGKESHYQLNGKCTKTIHLDRGDIEEGGIPIAVSTDSPTTDLLVEGYFEGADGGFTPLRFSHPPTEHSGELVGFFTPQTRRVLLHNPSDEPTTAVLIAKMESALSIEEEFQLGGHQSRAVDLKDIGVPARTQGALSLLSPNHVQATVVNDGKGSTAAALKDPTQEAPSHLFPVRLGSDSNTRLLIYNPDREALAVNVFFYLREARYVHPIRKVEPGEVVEIDMAKLRDQLIPGRVGNLLPEGPQEGLVKVFQSRRSLKKVAVLSLLDDAVTGRSIELQSCTSCPPVVERISIEPRSFRGPVGSFHLYQVTARFSDGANDDVTFSAFSTTTDVNVALAIAGVLQMRSPGTTTLKAVHFPDDLDGGFGEVFPVSPLGPFCALGPPGSVSATASVAVTAPNVSIASFDAVARDATVGVQVSVSNNPNNAPITLRLRRASGGSGAARFALNNSTSITITRSTTVQIKGVEISSTAGNLRLEAVFGTTTLASQAFTVIWVELALRNSDRVSTQNSARATWVRALGTDRLGQFRSSGTSARIWRIGVEIVGTVEPSTFVSGRFTIIRTIDESRFYDDMTEVVSRRISNRPDTSSAV